ncbi:hypothetical protein [Pseudozobellia sp. WGM2]|nr:hypothetical protein [Pseudozobellia sp. WGM2]
MTLALAGAPEWHLTNEIEMFDGAELFEVLSDGSEILRGRIVDKKFVIID